MRSDQNISLVSLVSQTDFDSDTEIFISGFDSNCQTLLGNMQLSRLSSTVSNTSFRGIDNFTSYQVISLYWQHKSDQSLNCGYPHDKKEVPITTIRPVEKKQNFCSKFLLFRNSLVKYIFLFSNYYKHVMTYVQFKLKNTQFSTF